MSSRPKRKYAPTNKKNPKRGGPGILLTCETGREKKCRFEGLDILNHYHKKSSAGAGAGAGAGATDDAPDAAAGDAAPTAAATAADNNKGLSLDDEIKQLKTKKEKQIFSVYDTGVRGSVTMLCTLPDCSLIAPFRTKQNAEGDPDDSKAPEAKKQKLEKDAEVDTKKENEHAKEDTKPKGKASTDLKYPPVWDPVETVRQVLDDLRKGSTDAPSSRFVTRMIPVQASCFTNEAEMAHIAHELFAKYVAVPAAAEAEPITFAIQVKRRICSHMKRQDVIELVAKEAPSEWKVNLSDPKYTLVVEIMKTLCCMSIIEDIKDYGNFNLVEMREKGEQKDAD